VPKRGERRNLVEPRSGARRGVRVRPGVSIGLFKSLEHQKGLVAVSEHREAIRAKERKPPEGRLVADTLTRRSVESRERDLRVSKAKRAARRNLFKFAGRCRKRNRGSAREYRVVADEVREKPESFGHPTGLCRVEAFKCKPDRVRRVERDDRAKRGAHRRTITDRELREQLQFKRLHAIG
jgi:hypothetical protein